ncbi:MAG TPA: SLBB domain-containing protein, partial [Blastocatellia bacterium]
SKLIADGLRGQYLKDPRVSIAVLQYNSRSFFIQGAVRQPGVYQIEGKPSLLKLITIAGGLADDHGSTAFIIRELKHKTDETEATPAALKPGAASVGSSREPAPGSGDYRPGPAEPTAQADLSDQGSAEKASGQAADADEASSAEPQYEMRQVNINGILKGNFAHNIAIEPGDIINIPPTDVFFVAGEVRSPGSYPLKDGTTLRQAISLAQGTTFKAKTNKGVIFREDPQTGNRQEITVDIGAIMSGKQVDIPIRANDVIIVPNSRFKSVGSTLLTAFGVNSARFPVY